jgi:hypothetical protein
MSRSRRMESPPVTCQPAESCPSTLTETSAGLGIWWMVKVVGSPRRDGVPAVVSILRTPWTMSFCAWRMPTLGVIDAAQNRFASQRPVRRRVLSDPSAVVVVVERRDRLARCGVGHLGAALAAHGRSVVVTGPGETADDLVREMIGVFTSVCARLCGRRGARSRAVRAVTAAKNTGAGAAA